jgi:FkbM family methyltransferase
VHARLIDEPFFGCDLVITADGGHEAEYAAAGVNHLWMPPGVSAAETQRVGVFDEEFDYDVVFVGTWRNYPHPEWEPHRRALMTNLMQTYPRRFRPFCCGFRGQRLADLYNTARIVIGDSCLAGGATRYWSDRIPETLGRGGFLIHPHVEGLDEHYTPGEHLITYQLGDFEQLDALIDYYLANPIARRKIARAGQAHVAAHHTYERRMADVVELAAGLNPRSRVGITSVTRGGVVAKFDLRDSGDAAVVDEIWNDGAYPLSGADVNNRVVVDIGANVGAFAIWAAKAGAAHVWAYEPDAANLEALRLNVALNGLGYVITICNEGVAGQSGDVWLTGDAAHAHVVDAPESLTDDSCRVVPVRSLDEVLIRAGERLIVKMDCEGCEHSAIAAVDPGHLRRIDRLVMEYHDGTADWSAPITAFGMLVRKLAEDGHVETLGRPSTALVNISWRRYGS